MSDDALLAILKAHTDQDADNFNELKETMEAMRKDLQSVTLALAKQKSFFGGVVFTVSALWAVVVLVVGYLHK